MRGQTAMTRRTIDAIARERKGIEGTGREKTVPNPVNMFETEKMNEKNMTQPLSGLVALGIKEKD